MFISTSLGSASSLAEQTSLFRTLSGSFTQDSGTGPSKTNAFLISLSSSWGTDVRYGKGSFYNEFLQGNFTAPAVLSGYSNCYETVLSNCGTTTASFAFLILALGVLAFGIYITVERRKSLAELHAMESEKVVRDEEGWEIKASDEEQDWETETPDNDKGWETNDEDPTA